MGACCVHSACATFEQGIQLQLRIERRHRRWRLQSECSRSVVQSHARQASEAWTMANILNKRDVRLSQELRLHSVSIDAEARGFIQLCLVLWQEVLDFLFAVLTHEWMECQHSDVHVMSSCCGWNSNILTFWFCVRKVVSSFVRFACAQCSLSHGFVLVRCHAYIVWPFLAWKDGVKIFDCLEHCTPWRMISEKTAPVKHSKTIWKAWLTSWIFEKNDGTSQKLLTVGILCTATSHRLKKQNMNRSTQLLDVQKTTFQGPCDVLTEAWPDIKTSRFQEGINRLWSHAATVMYRNSHLLSSKAVSHK